jgi:hypothetical protein
LENGENREKHMIRLRGHYDGQHFVLDEPTSLDIRPNTPVDIVILNDGEKALKELDQFLTDLWRKPLPAENMPNSKRWSREELHERG